MVAASIARFALLAGPLAADPTGMPDPASVLPPGLPMEPMPLTASGPDVIASNPGQPTILFVNFDGAVLRRGCGNDAHYDCSTLASRFDGFVPEFIGGPTQRAALLQGARRDLEPFGVRVVSERPPEGVEYSQIIYGALGPQSFAGIAPYVDCGNQYPSDTAFSQPYFNANVGSTVIVHEAGHTWGLEHVESLDDNMYPVAEGTSATFTDECHQIVSNTDLDYGPGICNAMHQSWCPIGQQNTFRELEFLFGPPITDDEAPTVEITSPLDGGRYEEPVVLELLAQMRDDINPQVFGVELYIDDELVFDDRLWGEVDFPFIPPGPGTYEVRIVVTDPSGKVAEDAVSFDILEEGAIPLPPAPGGCSVAPTPRGATPLGMVCLAILAGAGRSRRRRRPRR